MKNLFLFVPLITLALTINAQKVSDIDGNNYKIITIGTQTWMAENLKTTRYNNGDSLPEIMNNTTWMNLLTGACCDYNNEPGNSLKFGKLYNYYAVVDSRNLCPINWHIPDSIDWAILSDYLGGEKSAGGKLKESGTNHWESPNTGATDEIGFSALPGGYRLFGEGFFDINKGAYWWSGSKSGLTSGWGHELHYNSEAVDICQGSEYENFGFSVRCILKK